MRDIAEIDKNFVLKTEIDKSDIVFYDVLKKPFSIHGLFYKDGMFRRIPEEVAKTVSKDVFALHTHTAGGRVRFKTNSPYVAINAEMGHIHRMTRFAMTGSSGFDMYIKDKNGQRYYKTFILPVDIVDGYSSVHEFNTNETREITINFPLYSEVTKLHIGVAKDAFVEAPDEYSIKTPVVFYGSSITQGCCASRPGSSYESIISRMVDCDYINLGFSGSALAEDEIAEYIKKLDMSVFVYDYDHNSPSAEYLAETHEKMFKTIRSANPDLPIVMVTRPKVYLDESEQKRFEIVKQTYENAKRAGDKNVYFISGQKIMEPTNNEGTVDDIHPNDYGYAMMAKVIGEEIEKILKP